MSGRPIQRSEASPERGSRPILLEDVKLIDRINAGETDAYGVLVHKYQDRVFNTCWRICGHLEDARDLTQDAFLKAFERLKDFRQQSGFYTWVFRIAVNLALTHRRTAARRRTVSLDDAFGAAGTQAEALAHRVAGGVGDDPARAVGEAEMHLIAAKALMALDDDARAVVVLRDIEGFGYDEIAKILEIPRGTVKSRLHRARLALCQAVRPSAARDT